MDTRLRELERRARGGTDDEVAEWLAGRVRAGTLGRERLLLAAYCGHRPARLAAPEAPSAPDDLDAWVLGLRRWRTAPARAALAAARQVVPLKALETDVDDTLELLARTEALIEAPRDEASVEALHAAADGVARRGGLRWWDEEPRPRGWWLEARSGGSWGAAWATRESVDLVALEAAAAAIGGVARAAGAARLASRLVGSHPVSGPWTAPVRDVAAEALVAWALA